MRSDMRHNGLQACPKCGHMLDLDGICRPCRAARAARSQVWYDEHRVEASARRAAHGRLRRRFYAEEVEAIRQRLVAEQGQVCACCGDDRDPARLAIDWALDEQDDDGIPLLRGALCRSCKIAVGRYTRPSKFVLTPNALERVKAYVRRPWEHPSAVLRRLGAVEVAQRHEEREVRVQGAVETQIAATEEVLDFLASVGVTPKIAPVPRAAV